MSQTSDFKLKLALCDIEEQLCKIHGEDFIHSIVNKVSQKQGYKCHCCGFIPSSSPINQKLKMHIIGPGIDEITVENAEAVLLCRACFYVCHFEQAVKNNYFVLSNSVLSQLDIIALYRQYEGLVQREIDLNNIVLLSKKPEKLLEEMRKEPSNNFNRIKLLYTRNFPWGHSR